ncbi:hypothetical protein DPV78_003352 [Talaromyces pinophilus]|nr:hypothetical protein DPV78_003352 [Talaromyces pinophilus]
MALPSFMRKHQAMLDVKLSASSSARFMSVFFAVYACASSLLPYDFEKTGSFLSMRSCSFYTIIPWDKEILSKSSVLAYFRCVLLVNIPSLKAANLLLRQSAPPKTLDCMLIFTVARLIRYISFNMPWHVNWDDVYGGVSVSLIERNYMINKSTIVRIVSIYLGRPMMVDEVDHYCPLLIEQNNEDLESYLKAEQPDFPK